MNRNEAQWLTKFDNLVDCASQAIDEWEYDDLNSSKELAKRMLATLTELVRE